MRRSTSSRRFSSGSFMSNTLMQPVTVEEQALAERFYAALGRCTGRWSGIEHNLSRHFGALAKLPYPAAARIFFSARSFQGRYDMLSCLVDGMSGPPGLRNYYRSLLARVRTYNVTRNMYAHDAIAFNCDPRSPRHRQLNILPANLVDGTTKTVLGLIELETVAKNFSHLIALLTLQLTSEIDPQLVAPERLSLLVELLPTEAHVPIEDPTASAQFRLGLLPAPFPV